MSAFIPYRLISLLIAFCLVSACHTRRDFDPAGKIDLYQLEHWKIKARVAIKTPKDSVSATLDWENNRDNFDFHLYGTFGTTYAHLIQDGQEAVLKLSEEKTYYHSDAEQLLSQSLGWEFPIDALSYWIKGLPSHKPGESINRQDNGLLSAANLNGWQVNFSRYQNYSGYSMPRIIKAVHPRMSLKLLIKDWTFMQPD